MIVTSFDEWEKEQLAVIRAMPEDDRDIDCPECDGFGYEFFGDSESEAVCDNCDGYGLIDIEDSEEHMPDKREYFNQVVADVKQFCAWCNRDFLGEIGPFVREFRGYAKTA